MFSATSGDEAKRYLSPFKYFDNVFIMENSSFELSYLITGAVIIIVAIAASYFIYAKKDIHAV
jgi:ABC-2 type transport system permease protein